MSVKNFLKREIEKTGYPLEIEISAILDRARRWVVWNTDSYYDRDEGKLRDIDIRAVRTFETKNLLGEVSLVIECKKDDNFAWVFFTRPYEFAEEDIRGHYLDELQMSFRNPLIDYISEIILGDCKFHYSAMKRIGVSFEEFPVQAKRATYEKKRKEIFEAENQLKKFISYSNEQDCNFAFPDVNRIILYFPCIIFNGAMYEATIKDGKVRLEESNHVLLMTQNRTAYSNWELGFLVDVVTKDYFEELLKKINGDIRSFVGSVKKRESKIVRELSKLSMIKASSPSRQT